jgi:murein DD-endopeptidase MepM/ murein hydrolase activator NlpD
MHPFGIWVEKRAEPHSGIDVEGDVGDAVIASADGVVELLDGDEQGVFVVIRHPFVVGGKRPGQWWTGYSHLSNVVVASGQAVMRGEKIGEIGTFISDEPWRPNVHWGLCGDPHCMASMVVDPLPSVAGCFSSGKKYRDSALFLDLTYPVKC